jgi:ABC-2 type transport system ATP-binding protein
LTEHLFENRSPFRTHEIAAIAQVLEQISEHNWALVDLSVKESALEEIYVKLMTA